MVLENKKTATEGDKFFSSLLEFNKDLLIAAVAGGGAEQQQRRGPGAPPQHYFQQQAGQNRLATARLGPGTSTVKRNFNSETRLGHATFNSEKQFEIQSPNF